MHVLDCEAATAEANAPGRNRRKGLDAVVDEPPTKAARLDEPESNSATSRNSLDTAASALSAIDATPPPAQVNSPPTLRVTKKTSVEAAADYYRDKKEVVNDVHSIITKVTGPQSQSQKVAISCINIVSNTVDALLTQMHMYIKQPRGRFSLPN